jgi:TrkA domain protein
VASLLDALSSTFAAVATTPVLLPAATVPVLLLATSLVLLPAATVLVPSPATPYRSSRQIHTIACKYTDMTVYETDLPGVGKKFEVELGGDERLVVVVHNTGKREVFRKDDPDADAKKLLELSDRLARTVGGILEGAHFQPVESDRVETLLADGTLLEWYKVDADAEIVGQTLAEARIRERTGVSVVAIQRGDDLVPSPGPDSTIEAEDTLVVIGAQDDVDGFDAFVTSGTVED